MDTEFIGGVILHRHLLAWHPRLPPGALHSGPAPYLVDRRTAAAKSADSLPSSQAYRDLSLHLLMSARAPAELIVTEISQISVERDEPTMGQFYKSSESPPELADVSGDQPPEPGATSPSPAKRPRMEPPPQPQSKFFFTTWGQGFHYAIMNYVFHNFILLAVKLNVNCIILATNDYDS